jgi:hypothetical protein
LVAFPLTREHEARIREAAQASLTGGFAALTEARVLPRSRYQPWIALAHDYYGDDLRGWRDTVEDAIEAALPARFARTDGSIGSIDYPWGYTSRLLETAVAAATRADEPYDVESPSVQSTIDALLAKLQAVPRATVLQVVADVDVEHADVPEYQDELGETVEVAGVRVVRVANRPERFIEKEIPSAGFEVDRMDVFNFPGPTSLLVATVTELSDYPTRSEEARRRVYRLITALRLATASTARATVDVEGEPDQLRGHRPTVTPFPGWGMRLAHRPVTVGGANTAGLEQLVALIASWRDTPSWSPVRVAVGRLGRSIEGRNPTLDDQVIDLAVGLEAVLSGTDATEVGLRLRTRAAKLLATDEDSSERIYRDVRALYGLRSTFVHGGTPSHSDVTKAIDRVAAADSSTPLRDRYELALDRWRDLLRRAIVARCALAAASPPWPSGGGKNRLDVDGFLLDGSNLASWRHHIGAFWTNLGLASAPAPASRLRLHVGDV